MKINGYKFDKYITSNEYNKLLDDKETEYQLQCRVAKYLDSLNVIWTASCGGMRTSIGTAKKMKAMGYKKGTPDIMIFEYSKTDYSDAAGLFIELKTKKGKASPEQLNFINKLNTNYYDAKICYGYEDTIKTINNYLGNAKKGGFTMDRKVLTYEKIKAVMLEKGYKFYAGASDLNIVGIRSADLQANTFNDFICILYTDDNGQPQIMAVPATTDPGTYYRLNPMNVDGTAILLPGQYHSCWTIGMHRGLYKALVQCGNMQFVRDANRDDKLDLTGGTVINDNIGCNLHHAGVNSQAVDNWSAACQVTQKIADHDEIMKLADEQVAHGHGDKFSYTLLDEKDLV